MASPDLGTALDSDSDTGSSRSVVSGKFTPHHARTKMNWNQAHAPVAAVAASAVAVPVAAECPVE